MSEEQYNLSIILEHNTDNDPFEVFLDWLETQEDAPIVEFKKNSLLNNPSFRFINPEGESLKIDQVRKLNQELAFSSYDNKKRYFIILNSDQITLQAQNALLKSVEEPPPNTQIVLLTAKPDSLLPTVTSRCRVVFMKKASDDQELIEKTTKIYKKIISSKHFELIEIANEYKDRGLALVFFNNLLTYLHHESQNDNSSYKKSQLSRHLKLVLETIELLNKNVNVKLVVENCFFEFIKN